jgi:hypothetical protein
VELKGKESKGMLTMNQKGCSLVETDMMEWKELGEKWQGEKSYQLTLKPFEIRTYRLCQP